ncbi:hypothetical protein [Peribacillus sp. SI8-4]|uniref:hypothetical protein n=1 Tax=Peribacillus sp. SI8-4 TaxID=3048009 RepID=UPI002556E2DF|nr:hypothetical protein [Peribacillus sp. SI8-4]
MELSLRRLFLYGTNGAEWLNNRIGHRNDDAAVCIMDADCLFSTETAYDKL